MADWVNPGGESGQISSGISSAISGGTTGMALGGPIGAAIGAVGGLAGGLLSSSSNKNMVQKQLDLQRDLALNSISYKVADAKRAGIHPLYALGAPSMGISPIAIEDKLGPALADASQNIGSTISKMQRQDATTMDQLNMQLLKSQIAESDARRGLLDSEAARNRQSLISHGPAPEMEVPESGQVPIRGAGLIKTKPAEVVSGKIGWPEASAGINPYYEEREIGNGLKMMVPRGEGDSIEEILSEMSYPAYLGLLMQNERIYGKGWMKDYMNTRFFGGAYTGKYNSMVNKRHEHGPPAPGPLEGLKGRLKGKARNFINQFP